MHGEVVAFFWLWQLLTVGANCGQMGTQARGCATLLLRGTPAVAVPCSCRAPAV